MDRVLILLAVAAAALVGLGIYSLFKGWLPFG